MKNLNFLIIICATFLVGLTACESTESSSSQTAKEEIIEAKDAVVDAIAEERNELKQEMTDMQAKVDQKISSLTKDLESASDDAKENIQSQLEKLKVQQ